MSYTATTAEILRLRRMTGEYPIETSDYSDYDLEELIVENSGDLHAAAYYVWTWKAAALAANPTKFSVDGGTYDFTDAYEKMLANAEKEKAQSSILSEMIIDPTLEEVEE